MKNGSVQTSPSLAASAAIKTDLGPAASPAPARPKRRPMHPVVRVLSVLASLKLTVVLFSLSIFLVFVGTMAQAEIGIWTATNRYFRSFYVFVPFQLFIKFGQIFFNLPKIWSLSPSIGFPFFGGTTLAIALLVNLLAAHAVRFKFGWKRIGILLTHAGLVVMMAGEFLAYGQIEGKLSILQGGKSNYIEDYHRVELVFIDRTDPTTDRVVSIPDNMLRGTELIQNPELPVDILPVKYMVNSRAFDAVPGEKNLADAGAGLRLKVVEKGETSGASSEEIDIPSAYVTLQDKKTGKPLGTYLASIFLSSALGHQPQPIEIDGKKFDFGMRFRRTYKKYTMELVEFHHDVFQGTNTARNYSSKVVLTDPEFGERREVVISMNNPLTYRGETFYQSQVLGKDEGTVLQVVHNPGSWMPYISCVMVALGMVIHFTMHLVGFFTRLAKTPQSFLG